MKTSNKLLLGFLFFTLAGIISIAIAARMTAQFHFFKGNGKKVSQIRQVADFTKVNIKGPLKVYISQGPGQELKLHADENLLPEIETIVEDSELKLSFSHKIVNEDTVAIFVILDTLKQLKFSKGSAVRTLTQLKGNELNIYSLSGSTGDLDLNFHALNFEARAGSKVDLRGEVNQANLDFSSGAIVEAYNLKIVSCEAEGSSGGIAKIQVSDKLNVQVASGAMLLYEGTGLVDVIRTNSGGVVKRR